MNTAVRALPHTEILEKPTFAFTAQKWSFSTVILLMAVLLTGLSVIYLADLNRRLDIQLEETISVQNQLRLDWDQLLLEQSTWATQARIQSVASQQLGMQSPSPKQVVMIKASA